MAPAAQARPVSRRPAFFPALVSALAVLLLPLPDDPKLEVEAGAGPELEIDAGPELELTVKLDPEPVISMSVVEVVVVASLLRNSVRVQVGWISEMGPVGQRARAEVKALL
jgi:hypothetical protein